MALPHEPGLGVHWLGSGNDRCGAGGGRETCVRFRRSGVLRARSPQAGQSATSLQLFSDCEQLLFTGDTLAALCATLAVPNANNIAGDTRRHYTAAARPVRFVRLTCDKLPLYCGHERLDVMSIPSLLSRSSASESAPPLSGFRGREFIRSHLASRKPQNLTNKK